MKLIFAIGIGSFFGGIGRYLLSLFLQNRFPSDFPIGTFVVNIVGCFFIGLIYHWSLEDHLSSDWRLFLATGVLGGFTTFSAFSYESINLFRAGQTGYALIYIATSISVCLLATLLGFKILDLV